jgi:hypothetical protein
LTEERHFSLSNMALGSSLPFLSALIGTNLFDNLIDRMSVGRDRTRVRKPFLVPYALASGSASASSRIHSSDNGFALVFGDGLNDWSNARLRQ